MSKEMSANGFRAKADKANSPQNNEEFKLILSQLNVAAEIGEYKIEFGGFKNSATKRQLEAAGFKVAGPDYHPKDGGSKTIIISFSK